MKTIFRSIGLAMLAAVFIAAGVENGNAQTAGCDDIDGMTALDAKIRANYGKNATVKIAVDSGKEYLEKYGACPSTEDFVNWLKGQMPPWEARYQKYIAEQWLKERFARFDAGITADNADEVYAAGKEILTKQPDNLNIMVPMAMVGIVQSYKNNNKFSDDALRYAKTIVSKLKAGAEATKKNKAGQPSYGALQWEYTKDEAIDELTYGIAHITFVVKKDKKSALPLYYELSQSAGKYKTEPRVYGAIGDYYFEQGAKLRQEIPAMIADIKDTDSEEVKVQKDAAIEAKIAMFNGYAERAMDAFARAHKVAPSSSPAEKTYKDNLYKAIQDLYKQRFEKDTGLNEYIASAVAKPFPNPTSEVTPISDPKPVTTTTTTTATPTPVVTKPVSNPTKPSMSVVAKSVKGNGPVAAADSGAAPEKAKAVVKKPVAKRKGTR